MKRSSPKTAQLSEKNLTNSLAVGHKFFFLLLLILLVSIDTVGRQPSSESFEDRSLPEMHFVK